jgi:hypothetical protein
VWPGEAPGFQYAPKSPRSERNAGLVEKNLGLCRKPVERFGRRQVRQLAPPGTVVIVPYCGTGSEVVAALLEGYRVVGIEREPRDAAICRAQAEHVLQHGDDWTRAAAAAPPLAAGGSPPSPPMPAPAAGRPLRRRPTGEPPPFEQLAIPFPLPEGGAE